MWQEKILRHAWCQINVQTNQSEERSNYCIVIFLMPCNLSITCLIFKFLVSKRKWWTEAGAADTDFLETGERHWSCRQSVSPYTLRPSVTKSHGRRPSLAAQVTDLLCRNRVNDNYMQAKLIPFVNVPCTESSFDEGASWSNAVESGGNIRYILVHVLCLYCYNVNAEFKNLWEKTKVIW